MVQTVCCKTSMWIKLSHCYMPLFFSTLVSSKHVKLHPVVVQVHPYTYRNENQFLHFNFFQDPYNEYDFWINTVGVDGLFTDFTGTLHRYQELTSPHRKDETANSLLVKISQMISAYEGL
uniref:glycerophosphodiester phosphodiesterase n=1 Tax=Zea mays TaxID=4577 RepID=C4J0N6_MAIZE|nr:unknown [Zea mays]